MVEIVNPRASARAAGPISYSTAGADALAQGVDALGRAFAIREQQQGDAYAAKIIAQAKLDWTQRQADMRNNMSESGDGYSAGMAKEWEAYQADVLKNTPAGARNKIQEAFNGFGADLVGRATEDEHAQRAVWATDQYAQSEQLAINRVLVEPSQFEDALTDNLEAIDALPLPPDAKLKMEAQAKNAFAVTALSAQAQNDPRGVKAALESGTWDAYLDPAAKARLFGQVQQRDRDITMRERGSAAGKAALSGTSEITAKFGGDMQRAEQKYGLPEGTLARMAYIESRGNPNASNPSGADGLMQFMPGTAAAYGLRHGVDTRDASKSIDAAARLARDNAAHFRKTLGREPTPGEIYLMHQQGAGGATKLLRNPAARAVDVVGAKAVEQNGGDPSMTAGQFADMWLSKFDGASAPDPRTRQERVEAELADLPIEDRDDARRYAMQEIGMASERDAADKAAADFQRAQAVAAIDIDLSRGSITLDDLKQAYDTGTLKPGEYADRVIQMERVSAEKTAKADRVRDARARIEAGGSFDPGNPEDVKMVDALYDTAGANAQDDATRQKMGFTIAAETGTLPTAYSSQLNLGMARGDAASFEQAAALAQSHPTMFDDSPARGRLRDFQAFASTGLNADEAVQAANGLDQLSKDAREGRERMVATELKDMPQGRALKQFDGWFSSADASVADASQMDDEWQSAYRMNRLRGMGADAATAAADQTIARTWGPSDANGGMVMKHPPEMVFPPALAASVPAQLAADGAAIYGEGATYTLISDRTTQAEVTARDPSRPVSYLVAVTDRNGTFDIQPQRWTPSAEAAAAKAPRTDAEREVRDARRYDNKQFLRLRGLRAPKTSAEGRNMRYSIEQWEAQQGRRFHPGDMADVPLLTAPEGY